MSILDFKKIPSIFYWIPTVFFLYLLVGASLHFSAENDTLKLILIYISASGIFAISVYAVIISKYKSPIIFSLIGFCFWMMSLIVISYFWGESIVDTSFIDFNALLDAII